MPVPEVTSSTVPRFHPRVSANLMVTVHVGQRTLVAKARDLSMAGLFLDGAPAFRARLVTVTIPLPDDEDVTTLCEITRTSEEGVALKFSHLDWDDLIALARYLHPRLP